MKKRKFEIYTFNKTTLEVDSISTFKVKPVTDERFQEIIKENVKKWKGYSQGTELKFCYRIYE